MDIRFSSQNELPRRKRRGIQPVVAAPKACDQLQQSGDSIMALGAATIENEPNQSG